MPNRVKVATLAKGADAAEQAVMEARRALAEQEDSAARSRARSERKRTRREQRLQQITPTGPMMRGNG